MRYPPKQKQETRDRIVREAARHFRGKGETRVPIAGLMRKLNLTHGGFYRHFRSKEELFTEGITKAFEEAAGKLIRAAENGARGAELRSVIEAYLSVEHCANPAEGCPVAALASEIARQPRSVRARFFGASHESMKALSRFVPGRTDAERQRNFMVLFSGMAGALTLARAVPDEDTRRRILDGAREFYVRSFCS